MWEVMAMINNKEKGQAMIEFALVFPLFIIFVFFIIDVGWISYQKVIFSYTTRNITWEFYDKQIDNWVAQANQHYITEGWEADHKIKEKFVTSNANKGNKINPDRIRVRNSSISIYAGRRKYAYKVDYAGLDKAYRNDVNFNTTTYEITSTIYYDLEPITPIANMFFKNGITLKNEVYKVRRGSMRTT